MNKMNYNRIDLLRAIKLKDDVRVREIVLQNPELVNQLENKSKISPLWAAMLVGHEEIVKILMENGADPDEKCQAENINLAENTFLHYAIRCDYSQNKFNIAEILIQYGADVNSTVQINNEIVSLLQTALSLGNLQFIELLLKNGANAQQVNLFGDSLATYAFDHTNTSIRSEMLCLLLKYGLDIKFQNDMSKENLLHSFLRIKLIQQSDSDEDLDEELEKSSLLEISRILLDAGVPLNNLDDTGFTPLHLAIELKNDELVSLLVERGANVNMDCNEMCPLFLAIDTGENEIVEVLLDNGAEVNAKNNDGHTALHRACCGGFDDIIHTLILKGANITIEDENGKTPFSQLFIDNDIDVFSLILMLNEISKLVYENNFVCKKDLDLIQNHPLAQKYFAEFMNHLNHLANTLFYPPYSYYFVLKMQNNIKKLSNLIKDVEFVSAFKNNFPHHNNFAEDLQRIFHEATELKDQKQIVFARLYSVLGNFFPEIVLRKLEENLKVEDLPLD